jgi:hypothetical protein
MIKRILWAAVIGVAVTLLLIAASFAADDAGHDVLSNALFWQNWLLQSLLPTPHIGTLQHPFREGVPLTFIAWFASIPVGFVIYGALAFVAMRRSDKVVHG